MTVSDPTKGSGGLPHDGPGWPDRAGGTSALPLFLGAATAPIGTLKRVPGEPMRMPALDGRGFARAPRGIGIYPPIVVMTAARNSWASCDAARRRACIAKPFQLDAVARMCPA